MRKKKEEEKRQKFLANVIIKSRHSMCFDLYLRTQKPLNKFLRRVLFIVLLEKYTSTVTIAIKQPLNFIKN